MSTIDTCFSNRLDPKPHMRAKPVADERDATPELAIVIPTFNERDNIIPLVECLRACLDGISWEIVFVDDDSKDDTISVIRALARHDRRIRAIRRINRRGLSGACLEGILSTSAPVVAVMDADLQHDERCLPKMLDIIRQGTFDMVVASRFETKGCPVAGLTRFRLAGSKFAISISQRLLGIGISDPMSGFFMTKREVIEAVAPRLSNQGFKILMDIIASSKDSIRIAEMPFTFKPRVRGESKLDSSVVLEYLGLLVAKMTGDLVSPRMLSFCLVGSLGVVIHLAALRVLFLSGQSFPVSQTIAMFCAIASNYTFNNAITYKDRRRHGWRFFTGLLLFAALCSVGVVAGVGVSTLFYSEQPRWWLDGLAGAAIGVAWNYVSSSSVIWRAR